ncbi:MAG: amidohydrolase family protein [Treponema sp.]|jgi:cytosine deaminase|nr:amidohydrolase family protein [Treponema sp.]
MKGNKAWIFVAHLGHLNGHDQLSALIDMVTGNSAKVLCVEEQYGIEEGKPADMVILDAVSDAQAVRLMSEKLFVIRKGKILSKTTPAKRIVTFGSAESEVDFKWNGL